jgi:signal transduction histidine kinase/ActR/RegA family two-component response regulator
VLGQNPRVLKSGDKRPEEYRELWETIKSGGVWSGEFLNRKKNGECYWEYAIISPIKDARGNITHFVGVKEDITERKKMSQELVQSNLRVAKTLEELQQAQQQIIQQERLSALGTMASGIAHDFNNALASILGFSELLLHRPACLEDKEKAHHYLGIINTAAQDAGNVVNRLREFYRSREVDEVFAPINLNQLVQEAISLTQPKWKNQAEARGVTISIASSLTPVPPIAGNASDLREVLTNLIFNAVDAMPQGGTIMLRTHAEKVQVFLEITDTGTGMTEEVQRRCFDPFFSTKGKAGTGLGLSMVYGIIQRHEGTITVDSKLNRGTTFTICLPVPQAGSIEAKASKAAGPGRRLRVLMVDDEPNVREILAEFMTGDGHTVETADSSTEGLAKFRAAQFDVVVLDRAMPEMSGDQLAAEMKAVRPDVPIIMLTGFGSMMHAASEKPAAVDYVVGKPVTMQQLEEALATAAARPQA